MSYTRKEAIFYVSDNQTNNYIELTKTTKIYEFFDDNENVIYRVADGDEDDEYYTLNNAFKTVFQGIQYNYDFIFGHVDDDEHFEKKCYILPKLFLSQEIVKLAKRHNLLIVKFERETLNSYAYAIVTKAIYEENKEKFNLLLINRVKKEI